MTHQKTPPKLVYLNASTFRESMLALRRRGNQHLRAYHTACSIIQSLSFGLEELNKLTNHGESRIKHCRKYDLSNDAHRLVTVHSDHHIYLLHVGTHDEVDRWLDQNRGLTVAVNEESRRITVTYVTAVEEGQSRDMPQVNFASLTEANIPYLKRVEGFDVREFVKSGFVARSMEALGEGSSEEDILEAVTHVSESVGVEEGVLLLDMLLALREGNTAAAEARLALFRGEAKDVAADHDLEAAALADQVNSDSAIILNDLSEADLKRLFEPDKFQDWMLFLHPEQRRIADANYERTTLLTGVSGSGKTCVLVHRARFLARKYPGERIVVMTLNRSLSRLLHNLLTSLCAPEEMENIKVMAFYDYFERLIRHFGPEKELENLRSLAKNHPEGSAITKTINSVNPETYAREFDLRSGERLEDCWDTFLDQPFVRTLLTYVAETIAARDVRVDASEYLREEFTLIRTAVPTLDRSHAYLDLERAGRAIPLLEKTRRQILDLLLLYEETMLHGGLLDEPALTLSLVPHLREFSTLPQELRFRCLLVDEFQDFSTRDLIVLRRLAPQEPNAFFLTGDTVQKVHVKDLRLGAVGLDIISSHRERITKNYRNSRQILAAAARLANEESQRAKNLGEEIEYLDPELAVRETAKPRAIEAHVGNEIVHAYLIARSCIEADQATPWSVGIVTANEAEISVAEILRQVPADFPCKAEALNGDYTRDRTSMIVGSMSDVKGFEFSMVIIVGCNKGVLPPRNSCADEAWRHAFRLYVAMTRGRDQVTMVFSGEPSRFLTTMGDLLDWQRLEVEKTSATFVS
jgi:superfamily I DNA/RNA helicase